MLSELTIFKVLILLSVIKNVYTEPLCNFNETIDITEGTHHPNGVVYFEGIQYERTDYFFDENGRERGCVCFKKKCIKKCCPFGTGYNKKAKLCENVTDVFEPPVWDKYNLIENMKATKEFNFVIEKVNCPGLRIAVGLASQNYHLMTDGQLYVEVPNSIPPWMLNGPDKYCIDTFIYENPATGEKTSKLDALICVENNDPNTVQEIVHISCMLVSCVFILATLAVYAWLPELRNLHGMVLMVYLLCLFVAFMLFAAMKILLLVDNISITTCLVLSIVFYFALVSAFFWLNVMCYDIWYTFGGKRGHSARLSSTKARFLMYCLYAFGLSTILTIILISLEFSGLPKHPLLPLLRVQGCFLSSYSRLLYLYGPMLILCIANTIFFIRTALKIAEINKLTSVLNSRDNGTHDRHRSDKQRLTLYLKLFLLMGINWIMEVISSLYSDHIKNFWMITDSYNLLIGMTIFFIFVCKRKIFRLIKIRIKERFQLHSDNTDSIGELRDISNRSKRDQLNGMRASLDTIRTVLGSDTDVTKHNTHQ